MTQFTISRYNVVVRLKAGRIIVHNSASGATALLEREEAAILESASGGEKVEENHTSKDLIYGGFLVDTRLNELEALETEYTAQRFDPQTMILTIAPTLACNFGCDYCFQGVNKPTGKMSEQVQDEVMRFFGRFVGNIKKMHIAWYGGEPLLAQDVIERLSDIVIPICKDRGIIYDAMIVTNGYGLNSQAAKSLSVRQVKTAQVTLDGAEDYHDQRRCLLGGQGTYDRIISNLWGVINETLLRVVIRINIDSRNVSGVMGLLNSLASQGFGGRRNFSVYFAPVEAITKGCHSVASGCMTKKDYATVETGLYRRAHELGFSSLPYPGRFRGICGAVRPNSFVVVPNGDLHKCWDTVSMPNMKVGSVFAPELLATDKRVQTWSTWTPFQNETCRSCKILPMCAGSCAHKFINPEQTLGEAGSLPCPPWKFQLKERVLMLALRQKIIRRDEFDYDQIKTDPLEICSLFPPVSSTRVSSDKGVSKVRRTSMFGPERVISEA